MVGESRDALYRRMQAVFAEDAWSSLYPGVKVPKVYFGFPVNEPPFYVAVDEIVDTLSTSGAESMGHARIGWTLNVWLLAKHVDLRTASDTLLAYMEAVVLSVLADARLDMTVDNAYPQVTESGTSADNDKRYIAAARVQVNCSVFAGCPHDLMEVVNDANGN